MPSHNTNTNHTTHITKEGVIENNHTYNQTTEKLCLNRNVCSTAFGPSQCGAIYSAEVLTDELFVTAVILRLNMIRAYIPKYRLVESDGGRNYYVYVVEICYAGKVHRLEKRYSAFHHLYKEIQKNYITGEFPPKRVRNTTHKVLELRRSGLETWLHAILKIQSLPPSLLAFLELSNYQPSNICEPSGVCENEEEESISHRPILAYSRDPFLTVQDHPRCISLEHFCSLSGPPLTNAVTKGVLMALYDPSFRIA